MPSEGPGRWNDGPVAAVVGATGGLGSAVARELAGRGFRLVLAGRDRSGLEVLTRELPGSVAVVLDVRDPDAGDHLVAALAEGPGRLDVLVNAAGVVAFGTLADTPDIVIEELFLTNVLGPLWLLRRCLPLLRESGGTVVHLSAVVAERPMAGMAPYSATKAALTAADAALAIELRRVGVRVLDVRPPHTETGLAGRPLHGQAPQLPRGLDPAHVAHAIAEALEEPRRTSLTTSDLTSGAR